MRQSAASSLRPRRASSARRGRGRWPSPRSARPRCSPSTRPRPAPAAAGRRRRRRSAPTGADAAWPWPEARLTYANAALPEALLAAGHLARASRRWSTTASRCCGWLLDRETVDGHLSPTGRRRRRTGRPRAAFDQQPIEVAAMADACARADAVTGDTQLAARRRAGGRLVPRRQRRRRRDVGPRDRRRLRRVAAPTASTSTRAPSRRWR